jgi:hypothetical protein
MDFDPVSPAASGTLAAQLYLARKFDQAIQECRQFGSYPETAFEEIGAPMGLLLVRVSSKRTSGSE